MRGLPRAMRRTSSRTARGAGRATGALSEAPRARAPPRARLSPAARQGSRSAGRRSGGAAACVIAAPRQHAGLERVDERVPARLDHVLRHADRAPGVDAVGRVEQHARHGAGALLLVEDAHLEVDELDVAQVRVALADRASQGGVERVHGAVPLCGPQVALALDPDLDRGLRLHLSVLALLDQHAPRLEREERLVLAGRAPDQEVEGAVGGLELVAAVLELLHALDDDGRLL